MARNRSAMKRLRSSVKRRLYNKSYKSAAKTFVAQAEDYIFDSQLEEAAKVISLATKALDKAAQKGVIHPNNAARRKSRLMKKYNKGFSYNLVYVGPGWMGKGGRWEADYRILKKSYEDFIAYYGQLKKENKVEGDSKFSSALVNPI